MQNNFFHNHPEKEDVFPHIIIRMWQLCARHLSHGLQYRRRHYLSMSATRMLLMRSLTLLMFRYYRRQPLCFGWAGIGHNCVSVYNSGTILASKCLTRRVFSLVVFLPSWNVSVEWTNDVCLVWAFFLPPPRFIVIKFLIILIDFISFAIVWISKGRGGGERSMRVRIYGVN